MNKFELGGSAFEFYPLKRPESDPENEAEKPEKFRSALSAINGTLNRIKETVKDKLQGRPPIYSNSLINSRERQKAQEAKKNNEPNDPSRRAFLGQGAAVIGAVALAGTGVGVMGNIYKDYQKHRDESRSSESMEKVENRQAKTRVTKEEQKTTIKTESEKRNIADHFHDSHRVLKEKDDYFPKKLFTNDLLIAQEIQESGCDIDAISSKGAVGLMQNMEISIKDICLFLERLDDKKVITYKGPVYIGEQEKDLYELENKLNATRQIVKNLKYDGKKVEKPLREKMMAEISELEIRVAKKNKELQKINKQFKGRVLKERDLIAIQKFITHEPKYSRDLGELYLMRLYHKDNGLGAGHIEYNKLDDTRAAQQEILGAYNAGYSKVKGLDINEWTSEPRNYVKRIFNLMDRVANVRQTMKEKGLDASNDDMARFIAQELTKVTTSGEKRKEILDKATEYLIDLVKTRETELDRKLKREDTESLRIKLGKTKEINERIFYAKL